MGLNIEELMSGGMSQLMQQIKDLQTKTAEHVCIGGVTFKKADVKRAMPYVQSKEGGGNINVTKISWVDKNEEDLILEVSIQEFNNEFYK